MTWRAKIPGTKMPKPGKKKADLREAGLSIMVSYYFCKGSTMVPSAATLMVGFLPASLNSIS